MIVIIDYGRGNLRSVQKGFEHAVAHDLDVRVSGDPKLIAEADGLVLPGVGAFGDAKASLDRGGLSELITQRALAGVPLLGICLGMQLLLDKSLEFGEHEGLGLVAGTCRPFPQDVGIKVPHIGWNTLDFSAARSSLFEGIPAEGSVYFVHSYYCALENPAESIARTDYGIEFVSALQKGNIFGVQFHPEKSSTIGLKMLSNFAEVVSKGEY